MITVLPPPTLLSLVVHVACLVDVCGGVLPMNVWTWSMSAVNDSSSLRPAMTCSVDS